MEVSANPKGRGVRICGLDRRGLMVWGLELGVQILKFGVEGSWLGLQGARCVVQAKQERS